MSEQDVKIGAVGDAKIDESVSGETVTASVNAGPIKISLAIALDNKALLDLVISRLPAGVAQSLGKDLEHALFPVA